MAGEFKIKNGVIVDQGGANITGSSAISGSLAINASGSNVFTVDGTAGRLFSVDDSLTGSLFSVNTVAGLPIIEAFSDNTVRIGQYGRQVLFVSQSKVGIGKESALNGILDISGSVTITGSLNAPTITGSLFGTASWAINAITASYAANGGVTQIVAGTNVTISPTSGTGSVTINASAGAAFPFTGSALITGSLTVTGSTISTLGFTGSLFGTSSYALASAPSYIDNFVTVGLPGSNTNFNSIKAAVDSITDASVNNTYTVRVYPGVYIENTMTIPSYVAVKGDSSTSTVVSASNPNAGIFIMSDQTMVIDMQIQGSTGTGASAIVYSSPTTPQTNAIAYAENIRFGTNYTNATCAGSGSGNCILQCSNVKYGGFTEGVKSFDIGFRVTGSGGSIGRMQLRNVTSTNGGVAGTDNNQIFALADAPGCTFIVNGCLLTRATGTARGTGFKVYNGGQLRLTGVNFQRWINGIWAPQTGSAPSIDAVALNFENCTTDVLIEHTGSTGKVQGTDTFLKTIIPYEAPLYEVATDQRKILVNKKGGDFTSISASVAYIIDSSENNRYAIEVGPGQFIEKQIDLRNKPYVSIIGSTIQSTQIVASGSGNFDQVLLGPTNEISFLSINGVNAAGYAAIKVDGTGDKFAQAHKISIYDFDYGIKVFSSVSSSTFYGEYIDINGAFSYGTYVSASNTTASVASMENYYLFPSGGVSVGNYAIGSGAELDLYTCLFVGDRVSGSTAVYLADSAVVEVAGFDAQGWEYGVRVPNIGSAPTFRMVGSMIHNTITSDFFIEKPGTIGRFQGISDHGKINNVSEEFYWNFLDDTDGENDVTRKLSVTFADGTHTDATTLIFKGSPMGAMQGGTITISSGLTITTAAGFGYLQDTITTDVYKRLDWDNTNITLSPNTNNYIYLNDAGVLSAASSAPDSVTNIILGRVVTNNTGVEFIDQTLYDGAHMSNKLSKFNREALGPVFSEGSIVTEDATPFKLDVTQGNYFFSENNFLPSGTSSINLNRYYISGSAWNRSTSSIVPNNIYASGSQLIAMSASYYTKHTVYLVGDGVDEEYFLVINGNQYANLVQAEAANLPIIPTYFNDGVVPLAAVYVQSGSANITQIEDIRPVIGFRAAGVNASAVHGNLLGLTADDHLQYFRVDGTRQMSGDLGLGGNDIYNVSTINAASFTGSLRGTSSYASQANNATTADYASIAGNGGVTNIVAGSGITLIPTSGVGSVTVISSGTTTVISGSNVTQSFSNLSTWTFNHNLGTRTPIITVFDTNYKQIIPQDIELVNTSSATITFPTVESGFAVASLGGVTGNALSSSYSLFSTYATTASNYAETDPIFVAKSASLATTSSNVFRGNQTITGSVNINGSTLQSGNIVPSVSSSFDLGSITNPWRSIYLQSGSISIQSDTPGSPDTILSNVDGNILVSAGGIQLLGSGSFNATTASFQYLSGSFTHIGAQFNIGDTVTTGSLRVSGSTIQVGNNTQIGNTTISGSLTLSSGSALRINNGFYVDGQKQFNYGQFSSTQTQSGSANTAYAMTYNTTDFSQGVSVVGGSRLTVANTGTYNIQFSTQLHTTSNEAVDFSIWFAMTGSAIADSNTDFTLEKIAGGGFAVGALNFLTKIASGSYVELYYSKTTANGQLQAKGIQSAPARPGTPSVIVTVTQIA